MRHRRLVVLVLVAGLLAAGCRVQADVVVTVEEEGTGEVVVTVTLDQEAADRIPDLAAQLEADDLADGGWTVSPVEDAPGGGVVVSASKRYGSPDQLASVLAEVAGEDGPFARLALERSHAWAETEWTLTGEVDVTGGVVGFSDDELAELLGGEPLGYDLDALAAELGRPLDELVEWSLRADFVEASTLQVEPPGVHEPRSQPEPGQVARWSGTFADEAPTPVSATATRVDGTTRLLAAVAALALLLLFALLLFRAVRSRRRRSRLRREQAEAAAASVGEPARAGVEGTSVRALPDDPPTDELPVVTPPGDEDLQAAPTGPSASPGASGEGPSAAEPVVDDHLEHPAEPSAAPEGTEDD